MITFGIFADLQYADQDDQKGRNYRGSIARFLAAAGEFKARNLPFVIQLGDVVDRQWSNLTKIEELFQRTQLNIISVLGNHDFVVEDDEKSNVLSLLKIPAPGYHCFYPSAISHSSSTSISSLSQEQESDSGRWRIIILHGIEISLVTAIGEQQQQEATALREKYRLKNGDLPASWTGYMSQTQLDWLEKELTIADEKREHVLLCSHFPLFAQGESFVNARNIGETLNIGKTFNELPIYYSLMGASVWNGRELLEILDRHPSVKAYFAGHLHEGSYGLRKGVHHVTFKGMVESFPNAYAFVTLEKDRIIIEGEGKEPSRVLPLRN